MGDTLTELWISYNYVEKLKGINVLTKLKTLYISNNSVKDWNEFNKLVRQPQQQIVDILPEISVPSIQIELEPITLKRK